MSSQTHTVPPWVVRRIRLPLLSLRCVDCRSESAPTGEGRFRVNANRKLLTGQGPTPEVPADGPPPES